MKLPFELVQKHQLSLFQLEALFFGVSGLLLENQGDNYYIGLQNEYFFLKSKYNLAEINSKLKMGRMRPMNLPHVKIAQLAAFFHHVPDFINLVLEIPEASTVKLLLDFSSPILFLPQPCRIAKSWFLELMGFDRTNTACHLPIPLDCRDQ